MKIAIIGAGAAGLAALRHSLENGYECVAFEQTNKVGGTWNYVENIECDLYGVPVHSSMYQGLKTNLPKELMEFQDFHYKEKGKSFIPQADVLEYLVQFTEHFKLLPHIQFNKRVPLIDPLPNNKWSVTVQDIKTKFIKETIFDAVIICVGNYSVPKWAPLPGLENFKGKCIHSHNYRSPDPFRNRRVLVIGAGHSGTDISALISKAASKVFISYGETLYKELDATVISKPKSTKILENSVKFEDGTEEEVDDIIFCTGYNYSYPFLSDKCDIQYDNNFVRKLYKHVINIEHPTMAFIGIINKVCPIPAFGIQVRFFLALLNGDVVISREQMLDDFWKDREKRERMGQKIHMAHRLGPENQGLYFDELADTAKIAKLPRVIDKLYKQVDRKHIKRYTILNDEDFLAFEE